MNLHIAPKLDEDKIRQLIGNSIFVIIYNDSDEPFNPSGLFLGQLSTIICVVQRVNLLPSLETKDQYR